MAAKFPCELVSWVQMARMVRGLALDIHAAGFRPDLIIAIARGGYVPARLLADYLGVMDLTSFRIEHYTRGAQKASSARVKYPLAVDVTGARVLVVDDVGDTGDTFVTAMAHIRRHGAPAAIKTAALHFKAACRYTPDFYVRKVVKWRWITYPWAVIEDLTGFIERMEERPTTIEGVAARLEQDHGVRVTRRTLQDVLMLMRGSAGGARGDQ